MDINKDATSLFIDGTALIDLRGRMTRIVLRDFRSGIPGIEEITPTKTTIKSRKFHPSLK